MLAQDCPFPYETIVVDFGCPQGAFEWCRAGRARPRGRAGPGRHGRVSSQPRPQLRRQRGPGRGPGLRRRRRIPRPRLAGGGNGGDSAGLAGLCTVAGGCHKTTGRWGTCAVAAGAFHAVRGYDESLRGWGSEDLDFYTRVGAQAPRVRYSGFLATPIDHGDEERVRYQSAGTIESSNARNAAYLSRRRGTVNADGYGRGDLIIFRGGGTARPAVTWTRRQRIIPALRRQPSVGRNLFRPARDVEPAPSIENGGVNGFTAEHKITQLPDVP